MVPDFQTSMKEIREANLDFVNFLLQLKKLLTGDGTISFTIGGETIEVPALPSIIEQYRGGNFTELVLKSGSYEIHLKNNNGTLSIVDKSGAPVTVNAGGIKYSFIDGCTIDSIDAQSCKVDTVEALGGVQLSSASADELTVNSLTTASASVAELHATNMAVANMRASVATLSSLYFTPNTIQNIFAALATGPYVYADGNAQFKSAGSHYHYICCQALATAAGWKDPSSMGFAPMTTTVANPNYLVEWALTPPDLLIFQGTTSYDKYEKKTCSNCYALGSAMTNYRVSQACVKIEGSTSPVPFSQILAWPLKSYAAVPSAYPPLSGLPGAADNADGLIFLHEFEMTDVGRIIRIQTLGNKWKFPRCLANTYSGGVLTGSTVSLVTEIPPYTCLRLRMNRIASAPSANLSIVYSVLELT